MIRRYVEAQVRKDLQSKMVFVSGPRQVGKTTLAHQILLGRRSYFNWDIPEHRRAILRQEIPLTPIVAFDEIHKYRRWRNLLKGLFDQRKGKQKILVTGSAKLEFYSYGGDSLQGRYHLLRMHPLSVAELKIKTLADMETLLTLGGFPEPFFSGSQIEAQRWSREYSSRLITEELTSLERVEDLGQMELLAIRLPELVGSPLSLNSLREDLQISHKTVARWITLLERLYAVFRLAPFGAPRIRAVKKEQKHYHFDWSLVPDVPLRFENMVACHLLKWIHFEIDTKGRNLELRYFRDVDGRETDFVVIENRRPVQFIEVKWDDAEIDTGLKYLKARFPKCETWQISARGKKDYLSPQGIRVSPGLVFLRQLS